METTSIQDILNTNLGMDDETFYSKRSENAKRQLVVTAVLELIKSEATGGCEKGSLINNINNLDGMVDLVLASLDKS